MNVTNAVDESTQIAPTYYTGSQICTMFNVKRWALREWCKTGLVSVGSGKRRRFLVEDVVAFLERTK